MVNKVAGRWNPGGNSPKNDDPKPIVAAKKWKPPSKKTEEETKSPTAAAPAPKWGKPAESSAAKSTAPKWGKPAASGGGGGGGGPSWAKPKESEPKKAAPVKPAPSKSVMNRYPAAAKEAAAKKPEPIATSAPRARQNKASEELAKVRAMGLTKAISTKEFNTGDVKAPAAKRTSSFTPRDSKTEPRSWPKVEEESGDGDDAEDIESQIKKFKAEVKKEWKGGEGDAPEAEGEATTKEKPATEETAAPQEETAAEASTEENNETIEQVASEDVYEEEIIEEEVVEEDVVEEDVVEDVEEEVIEEEVVDGASYDEEIIEEEVVEEVVEEVKSVPVEISVDDETEATEKVKSIADEGETPPDEPEAESAPPVPEVPKITIKVTKPSPDSKVGIGFKAVGSKIQLTTISDTSLFKKTQAKVGQEIVSINGTKVSGMTTAKVKSILAGIKGEITLVLAPFAETKSAAKSSSKTTVSATKASKDGKVGIGFKVESGKLQLTSISPTSIFKDTQAKVGQEIVSINGTSVSGMDTAQVKNMLSSIESDVVLVVGPWPADAVKPLTKEERRKQRKKNKKGEFKGLKRFLFGKTPKK